MTDETRPQADAQNEAGRVDLERIRSSMALLQQNSEGCAINHYGEDFGLFGMPGWLVDTRADLEALTALCCSTPPPEANAAQPSWLPAMVKGRGPTADELEAAGKAPWQSEQPIEEHARVWRGRPWVPLEIVEKELQFWQRRDYEHGRCYPIHAEANAAQEGDGSEVRLAEQLQAAYDESAVGGFVELHPDLVCAAIAALAATPPPSAPVDAGPVVTAEMVKAADDALYDRLSGSEAEWCARFAAHLTAALAGRS